MRGNVVMEGYYNDPEATRDARLRGGCFHSGDAAVVHPDGYVEIRDRMKDVIISGGENISSIEVEGALLRHPAVQEVGRRRPAAREVGRGAARVRRAQAGRDGDRGRAARVRARAPRALQGPHGVTFVAELPKTATGKIQKFVLRGRKSAIAAQ